MDNKSSRTAKALNRTAQIVPEPPTPTRTSTKSTPTKATTTMTPTRFNFSQGRAKNNYAAPHTPIASAKRPQRTFSTNSPSSSRQRTPNDSTPSDVNITPMHPPTSTIVQVQHRLEETKKYCKEDKENKSKLGAFFSPSLNLGKFVCCSGQEGLDDETAYLRPKQLLQDEDFHDLSCESSNGSDCEIVKYPTTSSSIDNVSMTENEHSTLIVPIQNSPSGSSKGSAESPNSQQADQPAEVEEFDPYYFIKHLPPYELVNAPWNDPLLLARFDERNSIPKWYVPPKPKNAPPITVVLDLDETLVHCNVDSSENADFKFPVKFGDVNYMISARVRPHLKRFLKNIAKKFEVIVFTASQKAYADELLNLIDPKGQYIKHRMFRESCLQVDGNYLKDLNVLVKSNRPLSQMVLVDNSPHAFGYQIDNGIPIESWYDDPNDRELLKLEEFLNSLHGVHDVRPFVRSKFQTFRLIENA